MKYKVISKANAKLVHGLRANREPYLLVNYFDEVGSGEPLDMEMVEEARKRVEDCKLNHANGKAPGREFDAQASVALHESLRIPSTVAADDGFWRWLAFAEFADIVDWRHPGGAGFSEASNYGIGTIWNNLIARLWFRSEIVFLPSADDPYDLAKRGDVDLWRSHILRVNPGSCRNYARALVRFQCPDGTRSRLSVDEIREFAKRVNRLQATVALEVLSEDDAYSFVERLATSVQEEMTQA